MPSPAGFMQFKRVDASKRPVAERVRDYAEIELPVLEDALQQQASRCMDCGIPTCHGFGCPVLNRIPEFNELVQRGRWREASDNLHSTNNFPEFTGRVCPAPCEPACTLSINDHPVTIKQIELMIVERAWAEGWITPQPAPRLSGRRVAIIGSGPAGLAAAQQLARAGHEVVVFERDDRIGGLLRYGIPDFKLDKRILDRRLAQLEAEGVEFQAGVTVGVDLSARYLRQMFDAVLLTMGATAPRDLPISDHRGAANVHFAMSYLTQQNRINAGDAVPPEERISAQNANVIVIGGGDTGSDCVGTAIRQGAAGVTQLELLGQPPESVDSLVTWPRWPQIMRTSTSHEEGCTRRWSVNTSGFDVEGGRVTALHGVEVRWEKKGGGFAMAPVAGTEFSMPADLVLLACGFLHVEHGGVIERLGLELDSRGGVVTDDYHTSTPGVFAAGDCVRGASLVVHAIRAGREAAAAVDRWLHAT